MVLCVIGKLVWSWKQGSVAETKLFFINLQHFLELPVKDKVGTNSLELLQEFTKSGDNVRLLLDNEVSN